MLIQLESQKQTDDIGFSKGKIYKGVGRMQTPQGKIEHGIPGLLTDWLFAHLCLTGLEMVTRFRRVLWKLIRGEQQSLVHSARLEVA